jgi:hypothetical protein
MHNVLLAISVLLGSVAFAFVLGGVLSLLLPNAAELRELEERGREATKRGLAAQLRAVRENRTQLLDSSRLRVQWSESQAGRKMLSSGFVFLAAATAAGFLVNLFSV